MAGSAGVQTRLGRLSGRIREAAHDLSAASQALVGRLQWLLLVARADAAGTHWEFEPVLAGMNDTMDAITAPMAVTGGVLERLAARVRSTRAGRGCGATPPWVGESAQAQPTG